MTLSRISGLAGRGSRIRTCDLEYPKLPRYQTALYPAKVHGRDTMGMPTIGCRASIHASPDSGNAWWCRPASPAGSRGRLEMSAVGGVAGRHAALRIPGVLLERLFHIEAAYRYLREPRA